MKNELRHLLNRLSEGDRDVQNTAIVQLGILLEKSTSDTDNNDSSGLILEQSVAGLEISKTDARLICDKLYDFAVTAEDGSPAIWALGKAFSSYTLELLISLLCLKGSVFNDASIWQLLVAIDNLMPLLSSYSSSSHAHSAKYIQLKSKLNKYAKSDNNQLAKLAQKIRLELLG
ncbi:MAG: hypothetical protein HOP19_06850 [Acidobacteria bacterium]|nr:hypothetical protein [Acidobacteriota bacterium]